jgi:glycosyltransferase involved in cell wall biosynthesis
VTPRQYDTMADWYEHTPDRAGWLSDWKQRWVAAALQSAEGLFAWSQWAAQSAIEDYGADPKRVHIVPPGVDTMLWHPGAKETKPDDGIVRILFTGYALKRKGGDLLLRWARETTRKGWELHVVTMKPIEAPPGVVVYTDLGSNSGGLIRLAQQCDIFALPTRADCFSLASLEAMAVGLPVITTRVGGIPDIIREGETGYLLDPDDYDGLRDRLETLLDSPGLRREMGCRGRERVCTHFNGDDHVQQGLRIMAGEPY